MRRCRLLAALACRALLLLVAVACAAAIQDAAASQDAGGDTWAVIVSSSRYWLNYRHTANALAVYQAVKRLGLPDRRILLMLADQPACSPRNVHPGQLFLAPGGPVGAAPPRGAELNLQAAGIEVDYRGREVGVDSLLRVLTGRHAPGTPPSKRLGSGPRSRVLLYLTGHGGDEFLKFHDQEELLAGDVAGALAQMAAAGRYAELLLVADTCQAATLWSRVRGVPNLLAVASSKLGQSSYAHHIDTVIGQHVVDQFTFHLHRFLTTRLPPHPSAAGGSAGGGASSAAGGPAPSLQDLLSYITAQRLSSEVQVWAELYPRNLSHVPATHFFGAPAAPPPAAASGVDAAPGAAGAAGGGGSSGSSAAAAAAAQALQALAGQRQDEPHAAERPDEGAQLAQQPLFALLEAAGGGAAGGPPGGAATQAAATVAAWAAAAALSRWLFRL